MKGIVKDLRRALLEIPGKREKANIGDLQEIALLADNVKEVALDAILRQKDLPLEDVRFVFEHSTESRTKEKAAFTLLRLQPGIHILKKIAEFGGKPGGQAAHDLKRLLKKKGPTNGNP